jgi:2'-hydroxyisoflavone reductase
MDILILGGTRFVGKHLAHEAISRGHNVTLFNRGITAPGSVPGVEELVGDRTGDMSALEGRRFDAVLDPSGYLPKVVERSARMLADATGLYCFVSSISVFRDFKRPGMDESAPLAELDDPDTEDVAAHYGALKVACERVVAEVFGDRALMVRPGLIVGPHDNTNRFTYWVTRCARGGDMLAPLPADAPVQVIDVRDLTGWMIEGIERSVSGVFNVTGGPYEMREVLDACIRAAAADTRPVWVEPELLIEQEVEEWEELPLWIGSADMDGLARIDISRAVRAGLDFRPLEETARDTLAWSRSLETLPGTAGLSPAREKELLELHRVQRSDPERSS